MINLRVLILWLLCHGVPPCFGQTNIRLEPTIIQDRCPGDVVTLTCTITGASILAWRSEEYIGAGVTQLEFARANNVGRTVHSDLYPNSVYATLIEKSFDHLTSTLNITLSAEFQRSSVMCVNVGNGEVVNTIIGLLDEAEALRQVKSVLRREPNDSCAVDLLWDLPPNFEEEHVSHFMVTVSDGQNMTMTETSASYTMCVCDPHNVTITQVDRCRRTGSTTSVITSNTTQPLFKCDIPISSNEGSRFDLNNPYFITTWVFAFTTLVFAILTFIPWCCHCYMSYLNRKPVTVTRKSSPSRPPQHEVQDCYPDMEDTVRPYDVYELEQQLGSVNSNPQDQRVHYRDRTLDKVEGANLKPDAWT